MNSVPAGQLWASLKTMCRITTSEEEIEMKRLLNLSLIDIGGSYPFRVSRRRATGTFTASDTSGIVFPADIAGMIGVKDDDGNTYYGRDDSRLIDDEAVYRWYYAEPVTTALATGMNISATPGSTTISGPTITAAQIGEYIQIGSALGLYRIASTTTITPAFRGDEVVSSEYYCIRPVGTPRIAILDNHGDHIAATVYFHYWRYPSPLMQEYDLVPLPSTEPLELRTAVRYWGDYKGEHEEADRYEARYAKALSDCKAMNPTKFTPQRRVDTQGQRIVLGRRR